MAINIVIIGKLEETRNKLRGLLNDSSINIVGEFEDGVSSLNRINSIDTDMVIMVMDSAESDVFSISEHIYLNKPNCTVILITNDISINTLKKAINAGISNVLPQALDKVSLINEIKKEFNVQKQRRQSFTSKQKIELSSNVISVFGTKGGSGKTTIAVNLATQLAKMRKKVALIDLDLEFGDINVFMNINTNDTIYELIQGNKNINIDIVKNYMKLHSSGVQVLSAPNSPEYAEFITSDHIERLINIMRPYYDYIILDLASNFNETNLTAIERSQLILFIVGLDISILHNSKISLTLLETLRQKEKIHLVINRDIKESITVDDVKNIMKCPIIARIPSETKIVVSSLNKGTPFVTDAPRSKITNSISMLASKIINYNNQMKRDEKNGTNGKTD